MPAPIELYYWPTPNGWKVSIALEEMGLPHVVRLVDIGVGAQRSPEFLALSPNGRMPAITDPEGPDGASISIFESGAILQYLARKTGRFCGETERARIAVDQWLMWQMGGLGPMAGQAHHFLRYAPDLDPPQDIPYAKDRYRTEVARLYGVLDRQLAQSEYVAGPDFTIADMAIFPWARLWQRQDQGIESFPHMKRWLDGLEARPATARGVALHLDKRQGTADRDQQKHMFGPR
ncbi:glutathione S-transferase family protein [Limimaricola hongkongensis]|uniref:Glutathione S-transferase n=1 Tax=Limimaricola hongkongensis DSM 17492 TaxID=1122180 RepID=A0A017HBC7_9RHOB|nr:glutathione S-transferase N-terminal domain-containing protein [Limimaricola hongkongensis]EYD71064.1 Glutathione S-transferase [Limimaricola hongkongensis DSM 17492]